MSLAPSPSSSRGEIVLQPAYFTSSAFVHPARADIDALLQHYSQQYAHSRTRPFALFTALWQTQGWPWIQFKVFDTRSRAAFLKTITRLFSERIGGGETPLNRAAALFALHTILCTQPSSSAPPLYSVAQVEVTCDLYEDIIALPDAMDGEFLLPVRPHVIYVQSELLRARAFQILPRAGTHPLSPRALPREVVVEDETATTSKKKGRPSRRERIKKARESLAALDGRREDVSGWEPSVTRGQYESAKTAFGAAIGRDAGWEGTLREARAAVVERIGAIEGSIG